MTLAQQLAEQSKTNPPGLTVGFDTEERQLGARIATGEVTFDDIVSGKVRNYGGVDFTFPDGINFKKNPINDPNLQNKSFKGREGVEEILKSPEGTARLKEYFEKVKKDFFENKDQQPDDIDVLYQDPVTKKAELGVEPDTGSFIGNAFKYVAGYDTKPKEQQYVDIAGDIDTILKGNNIQDKLVRQIFTDHYEVGDFFTQMRKYIDETGKIIPYYMPLMAAALTDYRDSFNYKFPFSISKDENYYQNRKQNRQEFAALIRKQMEEDYNMRGLTRADAMNDHIHKELKVRLEKMHGANWKDVYKTNYLTEKGREIPIISEEVARQLDDYAYIEMPTTEKLLGFAMENSLLGASFSGIAIAKSLSTTNQIRKVRNAGMYEIKRGDKKGVVLNQTAIDALSDRQLEMLIGIDDAFTKWGANFNKRLYGIGNAFKIVGKADLGANELRQINAIEKLNNDISLKLAQIKGLRIQGLSKTDPQVVSLRNEVTSLVQAKNSQTVLRTVRRSPIFMGNQKDELLVAFGQAYGYELGNNVGFLNPEGGELLGALAMAFQLHTRPMGVVGSVLHFGDRALNNFFETGATDTIAFIDSVGGIFNSIDPRIDLTGTLKNRNLENIQKLYTDTTGKIFTGEQELAIKQLFNLTSNMSSEERNRLVGFLKNSHQKQERLVQAFPPDMQEEARQVFKQTFGTMAEIPGIMVYEGALSSRLHVNDLDNLNIKEINLAAQEQLSIQNQNALLTKRFLDLGKKGKLKPEQYEVLEKFVESARAGVAQLKLHMDQRNKQFEEYIDLYFENMMITPTDQATAAFDQGMLQDIVDALTTIRVAGATPVGEGASLVNQTEIMKKTHDDVINKAYKHLFEAASAVDSIKTTESGIRHLELISEKLYSLRYNEIHARGKLAYAKVDELLKGQKANITNMAEQFFNDYEELAGQRINFAFGIDGAFSRSTHGKQLLRTMNKITKDALTKIFKPSHLQEFRTAYYEAYDVTPTDTQLYFILRDPEEQKKLGISGITMPEMETTFYEIEELRKYFRDMSYVDGPASKRMLEFSQNLNEFLANKADGFPELSNARKTYQSEVFYPTDKTELMSQIKKSIIREEPNVGKIDDRIAMANSSDNPDTVSLSFKYDTKGKVVQSPQVWFDNFADDMLKFAKSGATEDLNTLNTSLKRILVAFGDRIDDGTGNPVYGIRLGATADASGTFEPTKFKLLQKVLESKVYQKWGAMRSKSYEAAVTSGLTRKGSDLLADINLPKFTATKEHVDKLEDILEDEIATLQQAFIIPVQAPNGETRSVKLIDLDRMLERERDISKIVLGFEEGAESFKALDNQWKIFLNQAESADVSRKSILVDNAMQKLNMIINGSDGKGYMNFYETYINNSSPSNFKLIREMFTKGVQAGPEKLSDTMTKQEFDLAAINALTSGILSKNKYGTDTYRIPDLNGNMQEIKTLENPLNFKDEFQKDNIQLIAEEIMGKKHVQDVNVILEAMHREISANAYRSLRGSGMGGLTRPISPNEIISRAFNLARGMVSPAYVTAEMLLRIASTNNIEVTRLVLQDKEVANVFSELMIDPKGFDVIKIRPIVPRLQEFVFSELVAKGKVNLLVNYEEIFNQGEEDEDLQ